MKKGKTRPLGGKEDWKCPVHGSEVVYRLRTKQDEKTGQTRFAGEYYACPKYWDGCGYYVSMGFGDKAVVKVVG